jgi:hypothetical protein
MPEAIELLTDLQRRIAADADLTDPFHHYNRLLFMEANGLLHVEFYGDSYDEPFTDVLDVIAQPAVAERLAVLHFDGPDEGANGTKDWDFSPLLKSATVFPKLTSFRVALDQPTNHNHSIIMNSYGYAEGGIIGGLLNLMPNLRDLTVPSAPDTTFFERPPHPLAYLTVDAGYDHQDFILNLSQSNCFPSLFRFDFGDYNQWYAKNYPADCVPFEHYRALFQSPTFTAQVFALRNAPLAPEQIRQLEKLRSRFSYLAPHNPKTHPADYNRP